MEQQITSHIHEIFKDVPKTNKVIEQKEELRIHLEERINDYMAQGFSFEEAFGKAKNDLGNMDELLKELGLKAKKRKKSGKNKFKRRGGFPYMLTSLAPFIYILMGVFIPGWQVWAVGWIIIPISGIFETFVSNRSPRFLVPLAPFVYVLMGVLIPGWQVWAWGWVIIPIAAILFGKVTVNMDREDDFDIDMDLDLPDVDLHTNRYKAGNHEGDKSEETGTEGIDTNPLDDRRN